MTQSLTDKTFVLVLRGNVKIYVNEQEFESMKAALARGEEMFEVQKRLVMKNAVLYIVSAADFDEAEKIKRGFWRCDWGKLHAKEYKDCSCGG